MKVIHRAPAMIATDRLTLCPWRADHRSGFIALNADPEVMWDYGGPVDAGAASRRMDRYVAAYERSGTCRWAIETGDGALIGYAGVMPPDDDAHPLGPHFSIGWRLVRRAWGQGYASEAARAALRFVFEAGMTAEVLAYTSGDNTRSHAVMDRAGLVRRPEQDFDWRIQGLDWRGLVWVARAQDRA